MRVLERGVAREVRLVQVLGESGPSVVKRFARRSLGGALLDRARAQREHDMLSDLHQRGVAVPRPLELRRDGAAWEVRMEWLDGARSIEEIAAGRAGWPVRPEEAAMALGRLLASLHACGVDHPDLHGGNALVDAHGKAWAIDFHKARRVQELSAKRLARDLARLEAGVRECFPARFRARFFWAWFRALPPALQRGVLELHPRPRELALEVERAARTHRAEVVFARRKRWARASPACRLVVDGVSEHVERTEVHAGLAREIDALVQRHAVARGELVFELGSRQRVIVLVGRTARDVRRAWFAAVRLEEHGIAVARPLCWSRAPREWAAFELPRSAEPRALTLDRRRLRELGRLCARLADRGLRPRADTAHPIWFDAEHNPLLVGLRTVEFDARIACGVEPIRTLALAGMTLAELSPSQRAAFAAGILRGAQLGRVARAALRADLRHG